VTLIARLDLRLQMLQSATGLRLRTCYSYLHWTVFPCSKDSSVHYWL